MYTNSALPAASFKLQKNHAILYVFITNLCDLKLDK